MARVGEGDPRWIVNEREDGSNVNQWHWDQKDKTKSAHEALKAAFQNAVLHKSSNFTIMATELTSFTGDVTVANRKGRLRCFFELQFNISWKAIDNDDNEEVLATGKFVVHDCDTQNYVEDFSIDVTGEHKKGEMHSEIMKQVRTHGKESLRNITRKVIDSDLMKANGVASQPMTSTSSTSASQLAKAPVKKDDSANQTSITKTKTWYAKKRDLYECFTEEQKVSALTRAPCKIDSVKQGKFSMLNDFITGEFLDLSENSEITMRWRLANWDEHDGKDSIVSIKLDGDDGAVKLTFDHSGIPMSSIESVRQGWERHFWGPMKQILGYGSAD